ncbi:MAG TPA: outer membrane beta-barrel domain-containing protein [Polyangia bacterium]|jgi:outer membrane beta-barrel protein|nr:outer membrane beta-barrel domain-containing protein [Polyangia bacterium]
MKRLAISLSLCVALLGWTATGHAKRGGGGKAAAPAADENAGGEAGGDKAAGEAAAPAAEGSVDTTEGGEPSTISEEIGGPKTQRPTTTLSWQDIVVVPRKAFLKGHRLEIAPIAGITVNDNLIRHYLFAVDLNFFLTDALWVGLQGQYFVKQLSTQEELVGLQFVRSSTLNRYLYGGAFNMGYVPVYGKFALFNRSIIHWEIWASGGFGITVTENITRNPAEQDRKGFKNNALTPNVGLGSRFFLTDWLTVNFALRDYLIIDKYEPLPSESNCTTSDACKAAAAGVLVNNFIAYVGVGLYLPTKFTYKTPR